MQHCLCLQRLHLEFFLLSKIIIEISVMLTVAAANISLALVILFCWKLSFVIKNEIRSPLQLVFNVMRFARKAKFDPFETAFTVNMDPPPRLDLAKIRYGWTIYY